MEVVLNEELFSSSCISRGSFLESLLGVERCLFVFVLDSQWKRAPPCHSNSPGAKLLSPDGTTPRHSLLRDHHYQDDDDGDYQDDDGNNFNRQKSGIPGRASFTSDFAPSPERGICFSNGWIQEEEVPGCQYILKYPAKLVFIVFGLFWRKQIRRIVASVLIKAVWNILEAKFQNGKFQSMKIFFLILITISVMHGQNINKFRPHYAQIVFQACNI